MTSTTLSCLANAPIISVTNCEVLEQIFVTAARTRVSFEPIASALSSVSSPCFHKLTLELRTAARRDPDHIQVELVDRLSRLDEPLSQIARVALEKNRKISLMLLGEDPEFLAQGFVDFQSLGHVWAGEEVSRGEYSWTLATPKNVKRCRVINTLGKLFRRKTSD